MIARCPVCGGAEAGVVLRLPGAPIFQFVKTGDEPTDAHFADFDLVRCAACAHLYNRAFTADLAERMYAGDVLTNVPVHPTMTRNLEEIASWIGPAQTDGRRVIEVGAGSGHLARILARTARAVVVFEPSTGLHPRAFSEANVTVLNRTFTAAAAPGPADLVVCRQVLEHVADPGALIGEMATCVAPGGALYLEVPRAEYIEDGAALFDLHAAHVQYFRESNFLALAGRAGLVPERLWHLKEGHDFGVLLRRGDVRATPATGTGGDLGGSLEARRANGARGLAGAGRVALYGATWQGVAFLNLFQSVRPFAFAVDDNADYVGHSLYSRAQTVPVHRPDAALFREVDTVVITAYLHDRVIRGRLRDLGFGGDILSARAGRNGEAFARP